jgi:Protein of unknown function (DUF3833)
MYALVAGEPRQIDSSDKGLHPSRRRGRTVSAGGHGWSPHLASLDGIMSYDRRAAEGGHPFDITQFLAGRSSAHGVFQDRFGRVRRSFCVSVFGRWDGPVFILDEAFVYDDGERETRQWRIIKGEHGRFTATCADCVGTAQGSSDVGTSHMRYGFRLKLKTRMLKVHFDDRMIRVDRRLAINRAKVSKWGITLGEVIIVFERQDVARRVPEFAEAAE